MYTRYALRPTNVGVRILSLVLGACASARPAAEPVPLTPVAEVNPEALLAELNPRGGAAVIKAWHGDDPEAVAGFYTEDAVSWWTLGRSTAEGPRS